MNWFNNLRSYRLSPRVRPVRPGSGGNAGQAQQDALRDALAGVLVDDLLPLLPAEYIARVRAALAQQDANKAALDEWDDKTKFVQEMMDKGELPVKYLGWHRADVMRDLIEGLTVADYEKVQADSRRLTAELGRLLMGDNAPGQPSLCDLVAFVQREGIVLAGQQDADRVDALTKARSELWAIAHTYDDHELRDKAKEAYEMTEQAFRAAIDAARKEQP